MAFLCHLPHPMVVIYRICFFIWDMLVHKLLWWYKGILSELAERNPKAEVVQVTRVIARPHVSFIDPVDDMLMCWHDKFISVPDLLRRDISLLSISYVNQTVSLAELDQSYSLDLYDTTLNPFVWITQREKVKNVINVPLDVFYNLTYSVDVSSKKVVFVSHTVRSGSTIWSQIFNLVPDCVVVSECLSFGRIFLSEVDNAEEFAASKDFENLVAAVVKFYVSRFPNKNTLVIKATYGDFFISQAIAKQFPDCKILFSYRDPWPSGKSWYRMMNVRYYDRYCYGILKNSLDSKNPFAGGQRKWHTQNSNLCEEIVKKVKPQDQFEWYIVLWCLCTTLMELALHGGVNVMGVSYDKLTRDPRTTIAGVFQFIGLDLRHVESSLNALKTDSQKESIMSQNATSQLEPWVATADAVERCNYILRSFGFSDLNAEYKFPNSL